MPVVHDTIPQFFNGVSQQASNLRRVSQVEDQVNCLSSITDGVLPRPPAEHIAQISATPFGNAFHHTINRDSSERFNVVIRSGSIVVCDMEGNNYTVTYPDGTGYLLSADPKADFEAYTVKDYTFILNKRIFTGKLTKTAGTLNGSVQRFTNLADQFGTAAVGTFYKVEGDDNSGFDSYYVEKTQENANTAGDVYTEVADPRLTAIEFDPATMPHQLVRQGDGTFKFQRIVWEKRLAGDDITNPFPSFTGKRINDIFISRNRLGFLSGDNVICSESGAANFFNFFRTTVTQLLDSDPIDVSANNTRAVDLLYAVPFDEGLALFSEQNQFQFGSEDILTPKSVEIKPTTEFVVSLKARPKLSGRNLYFSVERTEYTGFREYFVDVNQSGNDAADITKHVPRYIPKGVFKIVPSSNDDTLFAVSDAEPNALYVYQWYWAQSGQGLTKAQSAWHKWTLGEDAKILNVDLIDNNLYILIERENKVFLEKIDLTTRKFDGAMPFQVRLDRRVNLTGTYNPSTQRTTWTLPYDTDQQVIVVRSSDFEQNAGLQVLFVEQPTPSTVEALGDFSGAECIIGVNYIKYFTLSPIFVQKASQSGSPIARLGGRLQLRKVKFSYSDTAYFQVHVTPTTRETYIRSFTAPIGSQESVIGAVVPKDGVYSVPIMSKADTTTITILSDSYLPFAITSAEWEGFFHSNAR